MFTSRPEHTAAGERSSGPSPDPGTGRAEDLLGALRTGPAAPDPSAAVAGSGDGGAHGGGGAGGGQAWAGEVLQRRAAQLARAEHLARGSRAETTWATYQGRWARFAAWCAGLGESALPAQPLAVARFLAELAPEWRPAVPGDPAGDVTEGQVLVRAGLAAPTLEGYRAAISVAHQSADLPNPCAHPAVRRVLAGIRRQPAPAPTRRRTALRPADILAVLAVMDPAAHLADARDAALLLIGWKAALRTDDLHRLDVADLVTEDTGGNRAGLGVRLRRSKTDQAGRGVTIGILPTDDPDDPLDAVTAWTRWHNRLRAHGYPVGPAWRGVDRYGTRPRATRLAHQALSLVVTRRAAAAGLQGDYGGHSLRRGFATSALAAGASERAVQTHGRWRSPTSMAPYVDEATRYAESNPTRLLGA